MRWLLAGLIVAVVIGCTSDQPSSSIVVPASGPCAGIPVVSHDNPPDSLPLTTDPTLESKIPDQIDGFPVNDVASGRWIETLCMLGGEASVNAASSAVPAGLDLTDMRVASGQATVDGLSVIVSAFRLPGHSGSELIPAIGLVAGSVPGSEPRFTGSLSQTTIRAKAVWTWTSPSTGSTSYLYSTGDTLFVFDGTASQADKVLAALP